MGNPVRDAEDPLVGAWEPLRSVEPPASLYQAIRQRIRETPQRPAKSRSARLFSALAAVLSVVVIFGGAVWSTQLLTPGQSPPHSPEAPATKSMRFTNAPQPSLASGLAQPTRAGTSNPAPSSSPAPTETFVPGQLWLKAGQRVPWYVLHLERLCNHPEDPLPDVLLLTMARRLGDSIQYEDDSFQYVRDPTNRYDIASPGPDTRRTLGRFAASVAKPSDATFTGYVYPDGMELWRSEAAGDTFVFMRRGDTWERWPRAVAFFACS